MSGALFEPQVDIFGQGHRKFYRANAGSPAASDAGGVPFNVGDYILNVNPTTPGASLMDRCVAAGLAGTWETVATELAVSVALTNAQVKATNSAPLVIIPAQGAGTAIEICSLFLESVGTVAYANGGALALYYGTDATGVLASATVAATFLTSPTANQVILAAGALASNLASGVVNKGVVLANPTADFITGTGTLIVKVRFRVHSGLS